MACSARPRSPEARLDNPEAIVALGCRLDPAGQPSARLRERVALGVRLFRERAAPLLLVAGGGGEAEAMAGLARAAGVPDRALILETASRNTAENALYSARLLRERGLSRIVLVSHQTHLLRSRLLFRLAGLCVVASTGVPARSAGQTLALVLYETAALPRSALRVLIWR